ncbi:MAG: HAMP domain-containing protein [Chloroflexi bacterium]|nr:HAMP domain-containing protein [Chloroflexota bacterium]
MGKAVHSRVNSISFQLTVLMLAISVIPLFLMAGLFYQQSSTVLLEGIRHEFEQTAVSQSQYIDQWIKERQDDMVTVAGTARVRTMDVEQIADSLDQYFEQWGNYENLAVYSPNGETIYRTDGGVINVAERDYFLKAMQGEVNISEPLVSKASQQVVYVLAAPIVDKGRVIGVQTGTVSLASFNHLLESAYRGETGEAYLIGRDGTMLTASRFKEELLAAGLIETTAEMELVVDTEGSRQALAGETGSSEYVDYIGQQVVGAYAPIPAAGWGLIIEQNQEEALKQVLFIRNMVIIAVLALVILVAVVGWLYSRSITAPLVIVSEQAQRLSSGDTLRDYDVKRKDKVRLRKDEIGEIGRAFDLLTQYLQDMGQTAQAIAQNDLTVSVLPKSEKDELGNAFQHMGESLREAVSQVAESVRQITYSSDTLASTADQASQATNQIAITIQQVASGTNQQSTSVNKTAASIEQMSRAIDGVASGAQEQANAVARAASITGEISTALQQVAGNAQVVVEESKVAADAAKKGTQTVERTLAGMQSIKEAVDSSAKKVEEMGTRSEQVGQIVTTIEDIASQTNLLALNAAIEAARAGEAGKGFAVVADEVRKLAERAAAATKEIGSLIKGIQTTVDDAVVAMEQGAHEVEQGVQLANQAGDALNEILKAAGAVSYQAEQAASSANQMVASANELVASMDAVSAVVEENTAATEEMAASSGEVTQAIENIASVSEENSAAVEEVSASAEEMTAQVEEVTASAQQLAELAQQLQEVVFQFKLHADSREDSLAACETYVRAHFKWVDRARKLMNGLEVIHAADVPGHHDCALGKWYYARGTAMFGTTAEFKQIEAPHRQFHDKLRQFVEAVDHGASKESLNTRLQELETMSKTVAESIKRLEGC